jgi:hypothetical protein
MSRPVFRTPRPASRSVALLATVAAAIAFALAAPADAAFHIINVSEVYTNAQGDVQFIELKALSNFQTQLQSTRVVAYNADSTVQNVVLDFTAVFAALDNNETVLLATAAFQDTAGFAPDFVIPDSLIFVPNGRIGFNRDPAVPGAVVIDGVAYGAYTGANVGYGTPASALPTNGDHSLTRVVFGISNRNNSTDWQYLPNTPKRNDGMTTTIHAPSDVSPGLPRQTLVLGASRPNPTAGQTVIPFSLERSANVTLRIYSAEGRLVRTIDAGRLPAGANAISWDGRKDDRLHAAAGVYVYSLTAAEATASRRLQVLR